ncbi:hypothetical protein DRN89_02440, partial [archaeon]
MAYSSRAFTTAIILLLLALSIFLISDKVDALSQDGELKNFRLVNVGEGNFLLTVDFNRLKFENSLNLVRIEGCNTFYYAQGLILPSKTLRLILGVGVTDVHVAIVDMKVKTVKILGIQKHRSPVTIFSDRGLIKLPDEKRPVVEVSPPIIIRGASVLPVRFNPVIKVGGGHVTYVSSIALQLSVAKTSSCEAHITQTFYKLLSSLADNSISESMFKVESPTIDYLIITREDFVSALQPLIEEKESHGLKVKTLTIESILSNYNGSDVPEKIRNAIKDYYDRYGIEWVLLAGDDDIIPARRVVCQDIYPGVRNEPSIFPSDYYYAGLDGNWNADGDEYFGEHEDNVDYGADVFVGRLPVKNVHELEAVVRKIVRYSRHPISPDKAHRMLLCGAIISFKGEAFGGGETTDDAILKTRMITDFIPEYVNCTRVFQREYTPCECDYPLLKYTVRRLFDSGYPLVNFAGHGNFRHVYRKLWFDMDDDGVPDMDEIEVDPYFEPYNYNNTNCLSLVYVSACWTASMDENSLGKSMINYEYGGAIAYIGCVHSTWYASGWRFPGTGYDQELDYLFWKIFFSSEYSLRRPGLLLYKTKLLYASMFVKFPTGLGYEYHRKIVLSY